MQSLYVLYLFILTSSNLIHMRLKAILICSKSPVIVTILSGQEASDMFIFAPLYKKKSYKHYSNSKGMKYVNNMPEEQFLKLKK